MRLTYEHLQNQKSHQYITIQLLTTARRLNFKKTNPPYPKLPITWGHFSPNQHYTGYLYHTHMRKAFTRPV